MTQNQDTGKMIFSIADGEGGVSQSGARYHERHRIGSLQSIRFAKRVEKIRRIRRFQLESRDRRFDDTMMMNVITRNCQKKLPLSLSS